MIEMAKRYCPRCGSEKVSSILNGENQLTGENYCHNCGNTFTPLKNAASKLTDFR